MQIPKSNMTPEQGKKLKQMESLHTLEQINNQQYEFEI